MLKNLGVKARRTMRAFLGTTIAAAFCAVVSPALAGSVTQPGETIGLAAGAPLPEGVYFVNTLNWGVRNVAIGLKVGYCAVALPARGLVLVSGRCASAKVVGCFPYGR